MKPGLQQDKSQNKSTIKQKDTCTLMIQDTRYLYTHADEALASVNHFYQQANKQSNNSYIHLATYTNIVKKLISSFCRFLTNQ